MKGRKSKSVGKRKYGHIKLNADPLAQIIGTETEADIIINDAEACALLDSRATTEIMTLAYAEARNFDIRPMTELSDCFINLRLAARFKTTLSTMVMLSTTFRFQGFHHTTLMEWLWWLRTILPSARRFSSP